ncbi:MAG: hypothetical protein HYT42_01535 [Candidatus Sungbacteria bacterium]|nr:hypothetical protein [Candidatus Sungbacteria bacterium]
MNKKTVVIVLVLLLAVVVGVLLYFYLISPAKLGKKDFFGGELPTLGGRGPSGAPTSKPGIVPTPERKRAILQITDKEILAPTIALDGKSLLYVQREDGRVFSSDLDGDNEKRLTTLTVLGTFDVSWSPKKDSAAVFYFENNAVKKFINGVATGTASRILPSEASSLDWSPDGLSMVYLVRRASDTALVIADAANQNPRVVFFTPIPDFTVQWISRNMILLVSRPSGLAPSLVMSFDISARRSEVLFANLNGAVITPSPDGNFLLLSQSSADGQAQTLELYDFKKKLSSKLNRAVTIAEKCAFALDAKKIYCGLPRDGIAGPSPDEWYKGEVSFSDRVVEFDAASGAVSTLMDNEADVDVVSPFVSKDGKYLFFRDKKTSTLWRLTLKE